MVTKCIKVGLGLGPPPQQETGQIGLSLITDGLIGMTLITGRQAGLLHVCSSVFLNLNGALMPSSGPEILDCQDLGGHGDMSPGLSRVRGTKWPTDPPVEMLSM